MNRREFQRTCAALALAVPGRVAWADDDWPLRPVRIVVPYPPGTGPDVMARLVAQGLGKVLGATLVVENRPGANAIIGTGEVIKAAADGHVFVLLDRMTLAVNPLLYQPPYDAQRDLVSVSNIADVYLYLVSSAQLPVHDFAAFVEWVKARPEQVGFGTGGVGSIMHLNMELLQAATGMRFLHVPYKALAEVIPALLGGQVQATSGGVEAMLPHVRSGALKLLAVGAPERQSVAVQVPTIAEVGVADGLMSTSYSLHAKAGIAPQVVQRMQAALGKVLAQPELVQWAAERGLRAQASTSQALDAQLADDRQRLGRLVRELGIKVQ